VLAQEAKRLSALPNRFDAVMQRQITPEPFANPADPMSVGQSMAARHAWMSYAALAPLAIGQSDLMPNYYRITTRSKTTFLYDGELENPWVLLNGTLDVAFVCIYLLPLIVIAWSYAAVSGEREQGTLRMVMATSVSKLSWLGARMLVRWLVVMLVVAVVLGIGLQLMRPVARSPEVLVQLASTFVVLGMYAAFWLFLATVINLLGRSSSFNAVALLASWVGLVLIAPLLVNLVVSALAPAPSRTELATQTRVLTTAGLRKQQKLLQTDYSHVDEPQSLLPVNGRFEVPARRRAHFMMARDVDRSVDQLLAEFETQRQAQQQWVDRLAWVSPAIVVSEAMARIAGTDGPRYAQLQAGVSKFHERWRAWFEPRVLEGIAIQRQDFEAMPRWNTQDAGAQSPYQMLLVWHGLHLTLLGVIFTAMMRQRSTLLNPQRQ
jgi:ABC-2 type transport system permease protein